MRLLEDGGLGGVTVHAIAAEVDLTVGALYRYFSGKDAILAALLDEVLLSFQRALADAAGDSETPLEGLVASAMAYVALAEREPARYRLLSAMLLEPRQILQGDERQQAMQRAFDLLGGLLVRVEAAVASGELEEGDAKMRVVQLWSALSGALMLQKLAAIDPDEILYAGLAEATLRDLLTAWGAAPQALESAIGAAHRALGRDT